MSTKPAHKIALARKSHRKDVPAQIVVEISNVEHLQTRQRRERLQGVAFRASHVEIGQRWQLQPATQLPQTIRAKKRYSRDPVDRIRNVSRPMSALRSPRRRPFARFATHTHTHLSLSPGIFSQCTYVCGLHMMCAHGWCVCVCVRAYTRRIIVLPGGETAVAQECEVSREDDEGLLGQQGESGYGVGGEHNE
jgi:hypothetical protein